MAVIAWTLLGSRLTPSLENISQKYTHLYLLNSHFDLLYPGCFHPVTISGIRNSYLNARILEHRLILVLILLWLA